MNKKISLLVLITLFAVLVFNVNVFAQEVKVGGEIIVTDLSFKDAKTLDPHVASAAGSMRYIENMYNTLLRYEKGSYGKVEGDLVKEYEVSDDGKVYTFTLHNNIKFHNGDPLTSEDVKYSIETIIDIEVRAAHFVAMEDFDIVDNYTFKIILNKVVAPFTTFLAYPMNAIVNETVVEENGGNIDSVDAGSGPFKLVEWKKDQHLKLEKFEDYFREGLPYLDAVTLRPIPDETARTTALRNKEVDMILQVSPKEKMKLENVSGLNIVSKPGTYWEYLGLNTSGGPLANKKVRQAIAHAVD